MSSMEQEYYIREPQPQDKEAWFDLWPDYTRKFRPEPGAIEIAWQRLLDNDVSDINGLLLFSVENDELIGFLHYVLHGSTWYEGCDCYINDAHIKADYRYNGVFTFLYEKLVEEMKERGDCRIIHWRTELKNYPACAAYDKVAKRTDWVRYEHTLIETIFRVEDRDE